MGVECRGVENHNKQGGRRAELGLRKKSQSKLEKRQTKRQSNGFSHKFRTFYVNVFQGGNVLVRWDIYLSVGLNICPLGLRIFPLVCLFAAFFFPGIFKKKPGLFPEA
jgi:hypothetical protein